MIRDRWGREVVRGLVWAARVCAVVGAGHASSRVPSFLAVYYAVAACVLLVVARQMARDVG